LNEGDILITMTDLSKAGDTLGYSAKIPPHKGIRYLHNQRLGLVQFKNEDVDSDFLYWILRTKPYQYFIVSSATGSTVKHTSPTRICGYEFEAPISKAEQQQIAQILSSLDDKIELNLQMNQTLESMAQAIFKEWFVDFNFPDFDGDLVNGLPNGWRKGKVKDVCTVNSNTLSSKDNLEEIHYVEISEVNKGIINNIKKYPRGEEPSRAKRKLTHGDTVLSTVRPNRGSYFLSLFPSENLIASTGFAVFSPISVPFSFLYIFLTNSDQLEFYGKMADGAAYPAINQSVIMDMDLTIPTNEILELFHSVVGNSLLKHHYNLAENKLLTQTRDTLLPKLMSGQLEIQT
jgi:type I restriction enzyme S subunit